MNDMEWAQKELALNQQTEIEAAKLVTAAQEMLAGAQGGIKEFAWQIEYYKEHGKLP